MSVTQASSLATNSFSTYLLKKYMVSMERNGLAMSVLLSRKPEGQTSWKRKAGQDQGQPAGLSHEKGGQESNFVRVVRGDTIGCGSIMVRKQTVWLEEAQHQGKAFNEGRESHARTELEMWMFEDATEKDACV